MSNENDESIVLDRDTSKPEPRLKRKVKKVIKKVKKVPQKQKEKLNMTLCLQKKKQNMIRNSNQW